MSPIETQFYPLPLPSFVADFKDTCIRLVVPLLDSSISYIEEADSAFLFVILFVLLLQVYRTIVGRYTVASRQEKDSTQSRQIAKEIKDLKKELKSIQNMLLQLKSSSFQQPKKSTVALGQSDTSKLISYCKQSWQKREQIASSIMDWQMKIIRQVVKLKSKNRSSRSPSKNQISSSKQFSAQSKKSIKSTVHHIEVHEQENKALFRSDIKIKEEEYEQEEKINHNHQDTLIQVKIQKEQGSSPISSSINIQLHQGRNQIEVPKSSFHQQMPVEPSLQQNVKAEQIQPKANQQKAAQIPTIKPRFPPPQVPRMKPLNRLVAPPFHKK